MRGCWVAVFEGPHAGEFGIRLCLAENNLPLSSCTHAFTANMQCCPSDLMCGCYSLGIDLPVTGARTEACAGPGVAKSMHYKEYMRIRRPLRLS